MIFVGDDWSEDHHDVWVMNGEGRKLGYRRLPEGIDGIAGFHELVGESGSDPGGVVVGIETDRGLWVDALVAAGYQIYAVNPKAVARYRDRHHVGGGKSDRSDAKVLADLVRTDRHNHRPLAGDSNDVEAVKVLARTHQRLIWDRVRHQNRLRSTLREYYPAAVDTFENLASVDALAVLAAAPTARQGQKLSKRQIEAALKRGGRQRSITRRAEQIQTGLRTEHLQAPDPVTEAFAATTRSTVAILVEINRQINHLEQVLTDRFRQHPDADIYLSQPGLGVILGARMLGEFGDDPNRYADVKSRRNAAGTSPITIASGKHRTVSARWIRNNHLHDPAMRWAFCSITASNDCRTFYQQRKTAGDTHHQALRALANRLVGILHGCLDHQTPYNQNIAWAHRRATPDNIAA